MHVRVVEVVWCMIMYTSYQFSYCCGGNIAVGREWVMLPWVVDMIRGCNYRDVLFRVEEKLYLHFDGFVQG